MLSIYAESCTIVVSLLVLLFSSTGTAQEQKREYARAGTVDLNGNFSVASYTDVSNGQTANQSTTIFNIAPQLGYFPTDGFELGVSPGISLFIFPQGVTSISGSGSSSTIAQLFLSASYNFLLQNSNVFPFGELQLGYTSVSSGSSFSNNSASGLSWGMRGGVKIAPIEHILVSVAGQYYQITLNQTNETNRSGFNFLSFGVGVGVYF